MRRGDAIRALDHPYRRRILRVLHGRRITYSDIFSRLEPNGGERARFNYHLRSLRNADLVQLTNSLYALTLRGEAALVLLKGVSEPPESNTGARKTRPRRKGWRALAAGSLLRTRTRLIGRVGGIFALASAFLPWGVAGDPAWGGHAVIGLTAGIGGAVTLAFALAGLVAMAIPRRTATALAGILGVLAVASTLVTLLAMASGIAPALWAHSYYVCGGCGVGGLPGLGVHDPDIYYSIPQFGIYLGVVGALLLVLGAVRTLQGGRGTVAVPTGGGAPDRAGDGEIPPDEVDRSLQGRTTLPLVAH